MTPRHGTIEPPPTITILADIERLLTNIEDASRNLRDSVKEYARRHGDIPTGESTDDRPDT